MVFLKKNYLKVLIIKNIFLLILVISFNNGTTQQKKKKGKKVRSSNFNVIKTFKYR